MSVYISVELKKQIREAFSHCCAYCRTAERLTVAIFEVEHIIPLAHGGETVFTNLCFSCPTCNRFKGSRQEIWDIMTNEVVPLFHPQRQNWDEHFRWYDTDIKILGLTAIGRVTIDVLKMNRAQLVGVRGMWVKLGEHPPNR